MSATQLILDKVQTLIADPDTPDEGLTFADIWAFLEKDDQLSPRLTNLRNEPRTGLLLGIFTRVKDGKIEGLATTIGDDGRRRLIKRLPGVDARIKLVKRFLRNAQAMGMEELTNDDDIEWVSRFDSILESMEDLIRLH